MKKVTKKTTHIENFRAVAKQNDFVIASNRKSTFQCICPSIMVYAKCVRSTSYRLGYALCDILI